MLLNLEAESTLLHLFINMLVSFRIVKTMAKQYIFDKITILASMLSITDNVTRVCLEIVKNPSYKSNIFIQQITEFQAMLEQ